LENNDVENHYLSLYALKGEVGVGTIHFMAYFDKIQILVLIDG